MDPGSTKAREFLRALPKTELHLHLEGAVDAGTLVELAAAHDVALPEHKDPTDLYRYESLVDFLVVYMLVCRSVRTRADFERITSEALARCAASGVRYVELFFSPQAHREIAEGYPLMLDGVLDGVARALDEHGLICRVVPAINRELGPEAARELVDAVIEHHRPEVIGIGLDFDEAPYPPAPFAEVFAVAAAAGLHRTSHAGETGPAANVRAGIELLGCERVDHGYAVVEDAELLAECAASQIPFTVCPSTTLATTPYRDLTAPEHAIRRMADAGLALTVNSDDPPMMWTDLANEYVLLHEQMGLSLDQLAQFALNGLDATWLDDATKREWRTAWQAEIAELTNTLLR